MRLKTAIAAAFAVILSCAQAFGQAQLLPPGENCFQAVTGLNGMVGVLGTITGGSLYINGSYGGVSLTGGSGSGATANITVSGGAVTSVTVLNPGIQYVVGDVLSAPAASIGGTGSGFSVPVNSTSINSSLAGGSVAFYIPNTLTPKQTWQDSGESVLNTNPVTLDSNGCAVIYGAGIYRQILQDSLQNTVWDKLTASPSSGGSGIFWAGLAGGTGNAITVTDTSFALQDGATIQFLAKAANTGPTTISVSGGSPISIVNDTTTGPAALVGGEIAAGNTPMITYDATNFEFHIVNPAATTSASNTISVAPPQGYLNLVGQASGDIIQTIDEIGVSTIYYSPFVGDSIPIWNGSVFKNVTFSELTATLTGAGSAANSIQDECVFSNNGVPTLVTGPAWTTPTAGIGNRGTGAGTPQLVRLQGIWVNAVSIVGYNGLSSYSIPAQQCTYVGSIAVDTTQGQVSAYVSWGQSRKWGIFNAYNRQPIQVQAGENSGASYTTNAFRVYGANVANSLQVFMGLPEEPVATVNSGYVGGTMTAGQTGGGSIAIGWNSTTASSGRTGQMFFTNGTASSISFNQSLEANYLAPPSLGINVVSALQNGLGANVSTWSGTQPLFVLSAQWRG